MTPKKLLSYDLALFHGLTPADLIDVTLEVREQRLEPWQCVFDQEDTSFDLHFLLSGALLATLWTAQGRQIVFARFATGAYFGELAALDGAPRSLAVVAKTDARILTMKRQTFLQLYAKVPLIRDRVTQHLIEQIRILTRRNVEMTTLSVGERVRLFLLRLAADQGKLAAGAVIADAPTHAEIAGSVGANREMVSRAISQLGRQGVIKSSRQEFTILDPDALSTGLAKI